MMDAEALREVVSRYGTPAYVYDLNRIRDRVTALRAALPHTVDILYSVKANPTALICRLLADSGVGAEVASPGELAVALEAGFAPPRLLASGPYKSPSMLARLGALPGALLSVDSVSELAALAETDGGPDLLLRLRPDFDPAGDVRMDRSSRFGIPFDDLPAARPYLRRFTGFHIYPGSQILDGEQAASNVRAAYDLAMTAADVLGVTPRVLDLGGGFGVPYGPGDVELDLAPVAETLRTLAAGTPQTRLVLELGRYLVADAGWYLTAVAAHQTWQGRPSVVVDGGTHHRPDLCGLDLARRVGPPALLSAASGPRAPIAVLGCLCLPWDILAERVDLPPLSVGDVLVFPNAGAYGLSAAAHGFISHPLPAEVAIDGDGLVPLRTPSDAVATAGVP
jgi:diaminopimelate decarboxylase